MLSATLPAAKEADSAVTALKRPIIPMPMVTSIAYYILLACMGLFRCAVKSHEHDEGLWYTATFAVFRGCDGLKRPIAHPWMGVVSRNGK